MNAPAAAALLLLSVLLPLGFAADAPNATALEQEFARVELRRFLAPADEAAERANEDPAAAEVALARLRVAADAWQRAPAPDDDPSFSGNAHARRNPRATLRRDFFAWKHLFGAADRLASAGKLDAGLRATLRAMARDVVRPMERGPNNRSFHFALGAAHAARLFPDESAAATWRAYAEAVWQDWRTLGDCYEPGYVPHHLPQLIALGRLLGQEEQLRSPASRAVWARFRDHVSASGYSVQPGDGHDGSGYAEGLALAARVTGDGSLLAAAEAALRRVPADFTGRARIAALVADVRAELPDAPTTHAPSAQLQHLYPATHAHPERAILTAASAPARPFALFYVDDAAETLFHAHEDNRGALLHYEADGVVLLGWPNWSKWVGHANTFVVAPVGAEFPHPVARGIPTGEWRHYSANLRPLRYFTEDERWRRGPDSPREQYMAALVATDGLGYAWANPDGLAGKRDRVDVQSVTLRFLCLPEAEAAAAARAADHFLYSASFEPGFFWYREYRNVVGMNGPLVVDVGNLALRGPAGTKPLADLAALPTGTELVHFAAGDRRGAARTIPRAEWASYLQPQRDANGAPALRVTCPPGRLDLTIPVPSGAVDLTREFPRFDLRARLVSTGERLLRLPVAVVINGLRARSTYLDLQQGGVLDAAVSRVETRAGDTHANLSYHGVFTADSDWTRRAVLTQEGALVVLDRYRPGPLAGDRAGGPVWQLPAEPQSGTNWFSARSVERADRRVLVYFHPTRGDEHGVQYQAKFLQDHDYAVFARRMFVPGRPEHFLSVLLPHTANDDPSSWRGLRPAHGREIDPNTAAIATTVTPDGGARAEFDLGGMRVTVCWEANGEWRVTRAPATVAK